MSRWCTVCERMVNVELMTPIRVRGGKHRSTFYDPSTRLVHVVLSERESMKHEPPPPEPEPEVTVVPIDPAPTPVVEAPIPAVELREQWLTEVEPPPITEPWKAALQRWKEESDGETDQDIAR